MIKRFLKLVPLAMCSARDGICEGCRKKKERNTYFFNRDVCCKTKRVNDCHAICQECAAAAGKGSTWFYVGGGTIAVTQ